MDTPGTSTDTAPGFGELTRTALVAATPPGRPSRAVEVAALLDDSVVAVHHVADTANPARARTTALLAAAGALLLVTSAVAFAFGVSVARDNERAFHQWTESGEQPAYAFRPAPVHPVFDWMAFGGAALGIGALGWALARRRSQRDTCAEFSIGAGATATFATADSPIAAFPLVTARGDDAVITIAPDMSGEMMIGGHARALTELAASGAGAPSLRLPGATELPLPHGARARVRSGKTTYVIASVAAPQSRLAVGTRGIDSGVLAFAGGSALAHLALLALLWAIPPTPDTLAIDSHDNAARRVTTAMTAHEDALSVPTTGGLGDTGVDDGGAGGKLEGAEGTMGTPDSAATNKRYMIEKRADEPVLGRRETLQRARTAGIAGVFRAGRSQPFGSITGTEWESSGYGDRDIYGGYGDEYGESNGNWGAGVRGVGPGGGGWYNNTLGTGRYRTIGDNGFNPGMRRGDVGPGPRTRRHTPDGPTITIGDAQTTGYDKAIIRRHIRKKIDRIRYCYERELLVSRDLRGTVRTEFIINAQGAVASVTATGMANDNVESCVAEVIGSIQFPRASGAGMHRIVYPFHFHPAGS